MTTDQTPLGDDSDLSAFLISEEPETETETDETPADEAQTETDPEPVETEDDTDSADEDDPEADDVEDDDDQDEDPADEAAELITVKVDGREERVTLEELKSGYSGQKVIRERMKEAAEQRKALETGQAEIAAARDQFLQTVQSFQATGLIQEPTLPDPAMMDTDFVGYIEAEARYRQDRAAFDQQQYQLQQIQQQQSFERQQQARAYAEAQLEELHSKIPAMASPETAKPVVDRIQRAIENYGFSIDEIRNIADARAIEVLHDAAQWRELQGKKDAATAKAQKARPVVKSGAAKSPNARGRQAYRENLKRYRKTGRDEDGISLFFEQP